MIINTETRKLRKNAIEDELGIIYDEYFLLDNDKVQELLEQNRKEKKYISEYVRVKKGNEENAPYVKAKRGAKYIKETGIYAIAGDTIEQSRKRINDRIDDINSSKPISTIKKLIRTIKNR